MEKHRNVASKIFLEGGLTQKRLFDIGWWDISQCPACQKKKARNWKKDKGKDTQEKSIRGF